VVNERRLHERRETERRIRPSEAADVLRIEFENLSQQVGKNLRMLHRLESEVREIRALLGQRQDLKDAS
jgi:hypothetical protein